MGSPDPRQIDGMGGADSLTSKVAVVSPSSHPDAQVDYLFLQVVVNEARVDAGQNCGNILAGVGQFAIERGLVEAKDGETRVSINMLNTDSRAVAQIQTPGGEPRYGRDARNRRGCRARTRRCRSTSSTWPARPAAPCCPPATPRTWSRATRSPWSTTACPWSSCAPRTSASRATRTSKALEADAELVAKKEKVRLACCQLMNLGDVAKKTVPKMTFVSPARHGGVLSTRTFIPHKVHERHRRVRGRLGRHPPA